jgi:hypothetical protein
MELFKYLKSDVGLKVFETGLIRFSPPSAFNDPFELKPNICDFLQPDPIEAQEGASRNHFGHEYETLPTFVKLLLSPEQFHDLVTQKIQLSEHEEVSRAKYLTPYLRGALEERLEAITGVLCLADSDHNLTMWAHYADSHTGMVLAFDTSHEYFKNQDATSGAPSYLKEVDYHAPRPRLTLAGLQMKDIFLAKGNDWERERESRMFAQLDRANQSSKNEQGETIHLFRYPQEAITKVILGCRSTEKTLQEVLRLKSITPSLSRARIFRATPDRNEYRLNFIPVDLDMPLES